MRSPSATGAARRKASQPARITFPPTPNGRKPPAGIQSSRSCGNKLESTKISGISYYVVPFIRSWDAGDTTPARYMFTEDPGATNDVYRLWYYPKPTKLSSDSIPLSIGPPYDYMFLFPAVCAIYQGMQDGDRLAAVQKVVSIRNEYHTELNKGAQDTDLESIDRGF